MHSCSFFEESRSYLQVVLFSKSLATYVSFVDLSRLEISENVLSAVFDQVAFLCERFAAVLACVGLFSHMHPYVVFKIPFLFKDLVSPGNFADQFLDFSAGFGV